MKTGHGIYGFEHLELTASNFKLSATPKSLAPSIGITCKPRAVHQRFECTSNVLQFSYVNIMDYEQTDVDGQNSFISNIEASGLACNCCCDYNNNKTSPKNRFTPNVNFTSTPKIDKFRPSLVQPKSFRERLDFIGRQEVRSKRPVKKSSSVDETLLFEASKKSSLVLVSVNDYLRRLLQKKSGRKSSSVQNLGKRVTGKGAIDVVVSRKHSLRENRLKRKSVRRNKGRESVKCPRHESKSRPIKSSPIDFGRFCDMKLNESNNYNTSGVFSNGFNQLGQLKVWYV